MIIVYLHEEGVNGTIDKLGAFASLVKYKDKSGVEHEETLDNEDFTIVDEIVFEHVEEE